MGENWRPSCSSAAMQPWPPAAAPWIGSGATTATANTTTTWLVLPGQDGDTATGVREPRRPILPADTAGAAVQL